MADVKIQRERELSAMKSEPVGESLSTQPSQLTPPAPPSSAPAPILPQASSLTPKSFGSTLGGRKRMLTTEEALEMIKQKELAEMMEQGLIRPPF